MQSLFHIILISIICMCWGLPVWLSLKKESREYWSSGMLGQLVFLFFAGMLSLSLICAWASLLVPLRFTYLLIATVPLLAILGIVFRRKIKTLWTTGHRAGNLPFSAIAFIIGGIILCVALATIEPVNGDMRLYHLQIIRWTTEYGTVPGIANIYPRLGLGSCWFNLVSVFQIAWFGHQNFTFMNATLAIWALVWLVERWNHYFQQREHLRGARVLSLFYFLLVAFFLAEWQLVRDTANSTNYDFIVTVLHLVAISMLLDEIFCGNKRPFSFVFIIICVATVSFKLSGIFIVAMAFLYLLRYRTLSPWLKSIAAGLIILMPVLIKNNITTGYPLYPLPIAITKSQSQMPKAMTAKLHEYIQFVNKFYNHQQHFLFAFAKEHGVQKFNWVPYWFRGILIQHKIILLLGFTSLLLFFIRASSVMDRWKLWMLLLSLWVMSVGWFALAPDPRFAYGFLLVLAFLPVSMLLSGFIPAKLYPTAFLLLPALMIVYVYKKTGTVRQHPGYLLYTTDMQAPPTNQINRNNIPFYEARPLDPKKERQCLYAPLPCLPSDNPYVVPIGSQLKDGFMMRPEPDTSFINHYNF